MIYLSGAITSRMDTYKEEFGIVAAVARAAGYNVFNPAEQFGGRTDLSRSTYIRHDIHNLLRCEEIWMLPHWEKSEGARLEHEIAKQLGLHIVFVVIPHGNNELLIHWADPRSLRSFVRLFLLPPEYQSVHQTNVQPSISE